jgi:CRP-like cAMP-binding protein
MLKKIGPQDPTGRQVGRDSAVSAGGAMANSKSAFEALKNNSFLGGLPSEVLEQLTKRAHIKTFPKGKTIYRRGETGDSMMLILKGRAKVTNITAQATEVILNFLGKGDLTGEIATLDGRKRSADVVALEGIEALILYRRDLLPLLSRHPEAMLKVIAILCDKLRKTSATLEENSLDMAARTAAGLLRLARHHGRETGRGVRVDLMVSQRELGNYIGLSRSHVNRQLSDLRKADIIFLDGTHVVILDEQALEAYAGAMSEEHDIGSARSIAQKGCGNISTMQTSAARLDSHRFSPQGVRI